MNFDQLKARGAGEVSVLVSVAYPCPKCSNTFSQMRSAPVRPDGTIDLSFDFGPPDDGKEVCLECNKAEVREHRRQQRKRKNWEAGKPRLVK